MQLARTAMRPVALLSRHSEYMGSRLAVRIGQQIQRRNSPDRGLQIQASFFGVGAPEAVLVGLVALVIFGPQGLAQAAKTAGSTLKAFKPTLDELTTVSRDLRNTLDEELGINEIRNEFRSVGSSITSPSRSKSQPDWDNLGTMATSSTKDGTTSPSGSHDPAAEDPDIEAKRAQSAQLAWGQQLAQEPALQKASGAGGSGATSSGAELNSVSLDELQAELARRRAAKNDASSG